MSLVIFDLQSMEKVSELFGVLVMKYICLKWLGPVVHAMYANTGSSQYPYYLVILNFCEIDFM